MTATNRSETFGRLLKAGIASIANCEGKTAPVVEDELGAQIGVAGKSIQRYKAGYLPPEARTVQILAEACVRRGMMGREWLEAFLHQARYHQADRLLDQLRPLGPARPRPPRAYENLPAPTYSQFVMRAQAFAEVIDGLQQRSAAVLIVGMGGNGKTSLAREVAAQCLRDDEVAPHFDAVVWVSDKDRPGATNLSTVLDEIARILDYPAFTQFEHDEKRREVEQLLRRQNVLLVVDNFETITDGALLTWLLRLPEPSKALITSREKHRALWSSWLVELRGMSEVEAWELIRERARVLKMDQLIGERSQVEPLLVATGGNPKALTITLGLLKYERRPLQEMVDDLYAARGELFDDLFARAWALLDEAARRVLCSMALFPDHTAPEPLCAVADVRGFVFDRAVERLTDMALLDVQQLDLHSPARYALHPLVQAFAGAQLASQPEMEVAARTRWAEDFEQRVRLARERQPYSDLPILEESDLAAQAFLDWAERTRRWDLFLLVYDRLSSLWSARGRFDVRELYTARAIAAAQASGQHARAAYFLARQSRLKSYRGDRVAAERLLAEAVALRAHLPDSPSLQETDRTLVLSQVTYLFYTDQLQEAIDTLARFPNPAEDYRSQNQYDYWVGRCFSQIGKWHEARPILEQLLQRTEATGSAWTAGNTANLLVKTCVALGDLVGAEQALVRSKHLAQRVQSQRQIAELHVVAGLLQARQGDIRAARTSLAEAIDLFERLGMRRELAEARAELAKLEAPNAPIGDAPGA